MNNEIICTPVMLPMPPQAIGNCLVKDNTGRIFRSAGESERSYATRAPQHLYLVSDEEIKEGDWHISYLGSGGLLPTITKYDGISHLGNDDKKIVFVTDKSLSLPLIPLSFIEEWVAKQGKIDKVRVGIETELDAYYRNGVGGAEVIILPIEDKTFSREEVIEIGEAFDVYVCAALSNSNVIMEFHEWFDLNY